PAVGQARVARRRDRPRVVVARAADQVVGDAVLPAIPPGSTPPAPRVADLERDSRNDLMLHREAPLPVAGAHAPSMEDVLVDTRRVRIRATEIQVVATDRAAVVRCRLRIEVEKVAVDDAVAVG